MDKKEVRKRVLQNGKPLALGKFTWDEKTGEELGQAWRGGNWLESIQEGTDL